MTLDGTLITAGIAGLVSLVVSLISYMGTIRQIISEREKTERALERHLTEELYSLRLTNYPKAFEITEGLGKIKRSSTSDVPSIYRQIQQDLRNWKNGVVHLILSDDALRAFYSLEEALKRNPEQGTIYSQEQITKIYHLRNKFRRALRQDIGLLFEEEIEDRYSQE